VGKSVQRYTGRVRRQRRVRKKVLGTATRPRLSVYRSEHHVYAQLIDDVSGHTLAAASTLDPELKGVATGRNVPSAHEVGKLIAQRAKERGIEAVVFDRNGYVYHGVVKAVAEGAREGELTL
jgi:large subunit ribosomal protein L18